jgi:pectin methylesterase-like acyl-CoA thioesterase
MKKIYFLLGAVLIACCFFNEVFAQEVSPAAANWPLTNPTAGGTEFSPITSGQLNAADEHLNKMEINGYTGPNQSQRLRIEGGEWPANQTDTIPGVYVEFAVTPNEEALFDISSISFDIAAVSINTMKANAYYSTDPSFQAATQITYSTGNEKNYLGREKLLSVSAAVDVTITEGETFYLRIYPWVDSDPDVRTGKYVALQNIIIEGETTGGIIYPPTLTTDAEITEISTTFASSGGNVSSDGGSPVTARGVVWGTEPSPTTENARTTDGEGSGNFTSQLTDLKPGTTYFMRAYASNEAGTAYGEVLSFATLESLSVPEVRTSSVKNVGVESAEGGGEITAWGGTEIIAQGVVWNTTGEPSLDDQHTEDGEGQEIFNSFLYPLEENTTYYLRAYATNSEGTGYGNEVTFTTREQEPDVTIVVDKDGNGDYTTIQEAFDAVPDFYTGRYIIFVQPGTYYEKLILGRNKVNVVLRGEDPETTILTYDDYAGKDGLGTSGSYSVAIEANDFTAVNITFQNTVQNDGSEPNQQAVALRTNGDRQAYYNCHILGYQDTFYAWGGRKTGRIYMKDSYIEGSVDFIFGRDIVVFENCTINVNRQGGMLTAAATEEEAKFGFVFLSSTVTADQTGFDGRAITSFHLGRPWQDAPRTVFMETQFPATLDSEGWRYWNVTPALYGEYGNTGPGADMSNRLDIARKLTAEEAAAHTVANIFAKESHPSFAFDWLPAEPTFDDDEVTGINDPQQGTFFRLEQNYPNPFRNATTIAYEIKKASVISIELYDMGGRKISTLAEGKRLPGTYQLEVKKNAYRSGLYYYKLSAGGNSEIKRMIIGN